VSRAGPATRCPATERDLTRTDEWLARQYHRTGERALRNELVERHIGLANHYARRYGGRTATIDDLRQVALLAIVRAADRFESGHGASFETFAGRTIDGEIKRYLRDRTWSVRPPRRSQEVHLALRHEEENLQHELGRSPTVAELAARMDVTPDDVLEALEAGAAYRSASLDAAPSGSGDGRAGSSLSDRLESPGCATDRVELRVMLESVLDRLPQREQQVLRLRYVEQLTQPEIARRIGVSQSYLSRLLRRLLGDVRAMIVAG
jgi:RNA polymerase sigma-B factor